MYNMSRITFQMSHITYYMWHVHMSCVMYNVSYVMCHISCITCHLSLMSTATATDPCPAYSPNMHRRLVRKDQNPKIIETTKTWKRLGVCRYWQYQRIPEVSCPLGSKVSGIAHTHRQLSVIATYRLNWPRGSMPWKLKLSQLKTKTTKPNGPKTCMWQVNWFGKNDRKNSTY